MLDRAEPSFPMARQPLSRVDVDRFKAITAAATGFVLMLFACTGEPARALTANEEAALKALCKAGLKANGGIWASERINAAIATLAFGRNWPDDAQATAYKTCTTRGYVN